MITKYLKTDTQKSTLLIRIMVGVVFLSEGIQKFLYPSERGAGRFEGIGIPFPEFTGAFVGAFEVLCGALILIGLLTRFAALPTLVIMIVAISTTKIPILLDEGFWQMMHDMRNDWCMLLGSVFLLIKGGGFASVDAALIKKKY
jgi:putative oxidoreductase